MGMDARGGCNSPSLLTRRFQRENSGSSTMVEFDKIYCNMGGAQGEQQVEDLEQ